MASNIRDFEIAKTFSNVILSNIDAQPDTDGVPYDLSTAARKTQGRLQDGIGNATPLYLSRSVVELTSAPTSLESVVRKQELMESITYAQTSALIYG
jgi:hypothetical protein